MFVLFLLVGIVLVALVVALFVIARGPELGSPTLPTPRNARAKIVPTCDISDLPRPGPDDDPVQLTGSERMDRPIVGSTITLAGGVSLRIRRDLTLVAFGDIVIDDLIQFPGSSRTAPSPSPNITIVSLNGTVRIGPNGSIGFGVSAQAETTNMDRNALAFVGPGENGGFVRIRGINIDVRGAIVGNDGGLSIATANATGCCPLLSE